MIATPPFAQRLVTWQRQHGRSDLPWQNPRTPYRVWVSEIMLQQTQVQTVRGYFQNFMARFPDLPSLAHAHLDEVLAAWSGLGYYSRARNLHRCAQIVWAEWAGELPQRAEQLQTLPGIGPSTAAAIASLCHGEPVAILDGNVKRVLSRWLAFDQEVQSAKSQQALRLAAQDLLPTSRADMPAFTQGLMDLGAMLCKPKSADCAHCPVNSDCQAHRQGEALSFPRKGKALKRQSASWWLLVLRNDRGEVALTQRPSTGVWAGLWCCPMFAQEDEACQHANAWLGAEVSPVWASPVKHVLTHRDWWLNWGHVQVKGSPEFKGQGPITWWPIQQALQLGLPQPVRQQLQAGL